MIDIPISWLEVITSVEESEAKHMVNGIPFGFVNDKWIAFKKNIKEGDTLLTFCSPSNSWKHLHGCAGICLTRDGIIVDYIVTMVN